MEPPEKFLRLCHRLAFDALRHHRRGRFRDRAARALKTDVADRIAIELEIYGEAVAAERIEALGLVIGGRDFAIIARSLAVLEDHVLIEIAQVGHQAKTSRTFSIPRTSASTSAFVL